MATVKAKSIRYVPPKLDLEERDFLAVCAPAIHTLQPAPDPLHTTIRSITIRGARYEDKVAACGCADLQLYANADYGYTTCNEHGLQQVGHLSRNLSNGQEAHRG